MEEWIADLAKDTKASAAKKIAELLEHGADLEDIDRLKNMIQQKKTALEVEYHMI